MASPVYNSLERGRLMYVPFATSERKSLKNRRRFATTTCLYQGHWPNMDRKPLSYIFMGFPYLYFQNECLLPVMWHKEILHFEPSSSLDDFCMDKIHKFHNAPIPYLTRHDSEQKFLFWICIVGYGTGALFDLWGLLWYYPNHTLSTLAVVGPLSLHLSAYQIFKTCLLCHINIIQK